MVAPRTGGALEVLPWRLLGLIRRKVLSGGAGVVWTVFCANTGARLPDSACAVTPQLVNNSKRP